MANKKPSFKMTDEQKALFDEMTSLQKKMALNDIAGMKPAESHKAAGGTCKTESNRYKLANEILIKPVVRDFINSVKADAVPDAVASREEIMAFHTSMIRLDLSHLSTMTLEELTELKGGVDLRLKAAQTSSKLLAEMAGYNAAQKHDHTVKAVSMEISEDTSPQDAANIYKEFLGE